MFNFLRIVLGLGLLVLAGCATAPTDNSEPPPGNWMGAHAEVTPAPSVVPSHVVVPQTNFPAAVRPIPPAVKVPPPVQPAPILTWTSLNRWATARNLDAPRRISTSPVTAYSLTTLNGVFVLTIGSREATWNGTEIHLGFAPEIIDDQIYVHGLDLQKNLEPLMFSSSARLAFPNRVLVLDPGHGGINGGTVSVLDGHPEKDFTLDWARRIKALLCTNGWTVYLTRTNDADIALSNRVCFAEARHADLFVSLHFNSAAPDKRQSGLETYCLTPTGMPSTLTRNFSDLWSENFPNNNFDAQNLQLAMRLHRALLRRTGEEDRGIRRARFMGVLHGQQRPSVLIEGGFLSNPREAGQIASAEFRQKLAEAVANALR